jgi:two-component system nitrate/nitrite response regulator NarL
MLVDDHKTMLWGLERLIGEHPRMDVVATASNREQTVARALACTPDLIVLDIDLNGACSLDFLPQLLANRITRALVFSGTRDQQLLDRAVLCGARGILSKDVDSEVLLRAIQKVHQGELWIDHAMMSRVFGEITRPRSALAPDPESEKQALLTSKERKVILVVTEGNGAPNKALAEILFISEHTLRNHLVSIYRKLGVKNRLELYVYAIKHRIGEESLFVPAELPL